MMNSNQEIFYLDKELSEEIEKDFELIDDVAWTQLYKSKIDGSLWRLDKWDKLQVQYFIKLKSIENWDTIDTLKLRQELLKNHRGLSINKCKWVDCKNFALTGLFFCEIHAYEMGVKK